MNNFLTYMTEIGLNFETVDWNTYVNYGTVPYIHESKHGRCLGRTALMDATDRFITVWRLDIPTALQRWVSVNTVKTGNRIALGAEEWMSEHFGAKLMQKLPTLFDLAIAMTQTNADILRSVLLISMRCSKFTLPFSLSTIQIVIYHRCIL